ncbi:hypothetical protein [Aeromonas media]|uniref:hypothetical protein n=1 Tax=Aeromonas media TaxID=651 RepID=UPI00227FAE76|nr:hypothetical protein [Aeromonas media]MCY9821614.1 hypothetical protein [Aeromonas media]
MSKIIEMGPKTIVIRGVEVPEWIVSAEGNRWKFERQADLDEEGGVCLANLESNQCVVSPGVIYTRTN